MAPKSTKGKTKTSSKSTRKVNTPSPTPAIPTAAGGGPPKKPSLASRFAKKVKPVGVGTAKKERPALQIPDWLAKEYAKYAETKTLFDYFCSLNDAEKQDINSNFWAQWVELLWDRKSPPENPKIIVRNEAGDVEVEGLFQVVTGSKIKINMPPVSADEDPSVVLVQTLVNVGVEAEDAVNLVEREVDFTPLWTLNLTTLLHGKFGGTFTAATDTERSAAEPLFLALIGQDEEGNELDPVARVELLSSIDESGWSILSRTLQEQSRYRPQLVDPDTFLHRVCSYAHSLEQLTAILSIIEPQAFVTRTKAFVSDDPTTKLARLIEAAKSRLGVSVKDKAEKK